MCFWCDFLTPVKSLIMNTDATNPDSETRKHWVDLAATLSIPIRCIHLPAPLHICQHNDAVRALGGDIVRSTPSLLLFLSPHPPLRKLRGKMKITHEKQALNPEKRKVLPKIAFSTYTSRFKEPSRDEGFLDITTVEFQVCSCARCSCAANN